MLRRPNLPLAFSLGGLAAIALALNVSRWTTGHEVSLPFAGLAAVLLLLFATLPWTAFGPKPGPSQPLCHKCGAPFASAAPPASFCLMCGAFPRAPRPVG